LKTDLIAFITWLCTIPLVAITPLLFNNFLPFEKSNGLPNTSQTIPPASLTIKEPAAWSYINVNVYI